MDDDILLIFVSVLFYAFRIKFDKNLSGKMDKFLLLLNCIFEQ